MITKHCLSCNGYFQGELDGSYLCPSCRESMGAALPNRPLMPLDAAAPPPLRPAAGQSSRGKAA